MANNMQEVFWEVALAKDRKAFLDQKAGVSYPQAHRRTMRIARSAKSSIFATKPSMSRSVRIDRLAGRVKQTS